MMHCLPGFVGKTIKSVSLLPCDPATDDCVHALALEFTDGSSMRAFVSSTHAHDSATRHSSEWSAFGSFGARP